MEIHPTYTYNPDQVNKHNIHNQEPQPDMFPPEVPNMAAPIFSYNPENNPNKSPYEDINQFNAQPSIATLDETNSLTRVAMENRLENNPPELVSPRNVLPVDPVTGIIDMEKLMGPSYETKANENSNEAKSNENSNENLDTFPPIFTNDVQEKKEESKAQAQQPIPQYQKELPPEPPKIFSRAIDPADFDKENNISTNSPPIPRIDPHDKSSVSSEAEKHLEKFERRRSKAKKHEIKQAHYREERRIDAEIALSSIPPIIDRGMAVGSVLIDAVKEFTEAGLKKLDKKLAEREYEKAKSLGLDSDPRELKIN